MGKNKFKKKDKEAENGGTCVLDNGKPHASTICHNDVQAEKIPNKSHKNNVPIDVPVNGSSEGDSTFSKVKKKKKKKRKCKDADSEDSKAPVSENLTGTVGEDVTGTKAPVGEDVTGTKAPVSEDLTENSSVSKSKKNKKRKRKRSNSDTKNDDISDSEATIKKQKTNDVNDIAEVNKETSKCSMTENNEGVTDSKKKKRKKQKKRNKHETTPSSGTQQEDGKTDTQTDGNTGQWSSAGFEDSNRQNKFFKLLGGFKNKDATSAIQKKFSLGGGAKTFKPNQSSWDRSHGGVDKSHGGGNAMDKKQQDVYNKTMETEFNRALSTNVNRGIGLGFAQASKKFHIDTTESKSIKFDN